MAPENSFGRVPIVDQGLEDCSRRTEQQWQKPGVGRTCRVGDVVRAVDLFELVMSLAVCVLCVCVQLVGGDQSDD